MSDHEKQLEQKIREAVHQRKTDDASVVVRDRQGHWLFEVYGGDDLSVKVKSSTSGER